MRKVLLGLLFLIPIITNAQKWEEAVTDKFTGAATFTTTKERLSEKLHTTLQVYGVHSVMSGDSANLLFFDFDAREVMSISDSKNLIFRFSNGEILSSPFIGLDKIYGTDDPVIFPIDAKKKILEKLRDNTVTDIRIETSGINMDFEIKELAQNTIKNMAVLMLQKL